MKRASFWAIVIIVITIIIFILNSFKVNRRSSNFSINELKINGIYIKTQIAKSQKEIEKGLGGQNKIDEKEGMLFIMPFSKRYGFWMKDMKFPIDIIWIDNDTIIDITKNLPVTNTKYLPVYQPNKAVNFILEVNAGFCDKYKIEVNDRVEGLEMIVDP